MRAHDMSEMGHLTGPRDQCTDRPIYEGLHPQDAAALKYNRPSANPTETIAAKYIAKLEARIADLREHSMTWADSFLQAQLSEAENRVRELKEENAEHQHMQTQLLDENAALRAMLSEMTGSYGAFCAGFDRGWHAAAAGEDIVASEAWGDWPEDYRIAGEMIASAIERETNGKA